MPRRTYERREEVEVIQTRVWIPVEARFDNPSGTADQEYVKIVAYWTEVGASDLPKGEATLQRVEGHIGVSGTNVSVACQLSQQPRGGSLQRGSVLKPMPLTALPIVGTNQIAYAAISSKTQRKLGRDFNPEDISVDLGYAGGTPSKVNLSLWLLVGFRG